YLIDQWFDGTVSSASRCRTYIMGNLDITATETSSFVPDNASPLVLGSTDASDPRPFGGYLSEIIMYRTALHEAERIIVDNYLAAKYGLTLLANDKYVGDDPGYGNYDLQVAGVGQEANGNNMSFAPSVSGGLGITVQGGFNDGDYILAGHNTATNSDNITDVGGMTGTFNGRWERVWYFDITNSSTSMSGELAFDFSEGGTGSTTVGVVSNYVLLYRPGQTGNWTELAPASSSNGDQIIFSNVALTIDGYYTIGTRNFNLSPLPVELV